jgi:hypothetical protein
MATIERYARGEFATDLVPGDFILTHRHRPFAALISLAQRRRFRGADAPYAHWSHAAVLVSAGGELVEAESTGVIRSTIAKYRDGEYHLVRLGDDLPQPQRGRAVEYARGQIGQAFGYLDLAGATLYLLTGIPLRWVRRHHEICSSLVVRTLQHGGLLKGFDPAITLPADLAKEFGVRP